MERQCARQIHRTTPGIFHGPERTSAPPTPRARPARHGHGRRGREGRIVRKGARPRATPIPATGPSNEGCAQTCSRHAIMGQDLGSGTQRKDASTAPGPAKHQGAGRHATVEGQHRGRRPSKRKDHESGPRDAARKGHDDGWSPTEGRVIRVLGIVVVPDPVNVSERTEQKYRHTAYRRKPRRPCSSAGPPAPRHRDAAHRGPSTPHQRGRDRLAVAPDGQPAAQQKRPSYQEKETVRQVARKISTMNGHLGGLRDFRLGDGVLIGEGYVGQLILSGSRR